MKILVDTQWRTAARTFEILFLKLAQSWHTMLNVMNAEHNVWASSDMCTHFLRPVRFQWSPKIERPVWWEDRIDWPGSKWEWIPELSLRLCVENRPGERSLLIISQQPDYFCLSSLWQKIYSFSVFLMEKKNHLLVFIFTFAFLLNQVGSLYELVLN